MNNLNIINGRNYNYEIDNNISVIPLTYIEVATPIFDQVVLLINNLLRNKGIGNKK